MGMNIPKGYELLSGRGRENAIKAIDLAKERGLDSYSVLTIGEGYLIPTDGSDETELEYVELPAKTATKAEFEAFAAEHGVDISSASNNEQRYDLISQWADDLAEAEGHEASDDDSQESE